MQSPLAISHSLCRRCFFPFFFFFNATATTEIYTLSLHDALPIYSTCLPDFGGHSILNVLLRMDAGSRSLSTAHAWTVFPDRKSTRLNSSHGYISYAVFCLKKKKKAQKPKTQ